MDDPDAEFLATIRAVAADRELLPPLIGKYVMAFAAVENKADQAIHEILMLDLVAGMALTDAILNFSARLDILENLLLRLLPDDHERATLLLIVDKIKDANSFRNGVVHSHWDSSIFDHETGEIQHMKVRMAPTKRGRQIKHTGYTVTAIKEGIQVCETLLAELNIAMGALFRRRFALQEAIKNGQ